MLTIGHSTLPIETFLAILRENGVRTLADIRTIPKSRHNPQFAQENLSRSLVEAGIEYRWHRALGGLRHSLKDSVNTGWRNASFRGYADYMQTPEFATAISELLNASPHDHTAIMCAEAVPWRCHRSLVADDLTVRGIPVEHIYYDTHGKSRREPAHRQPRAPGSATRERGHDCPPPARPRRCRSRARRTQSRPPPKIRRKNRNTFSASRKIDAAISGAEVMSFDRRSRWKSTIVKAAKITSPRIE